MTQVRSRYFCTMRMFLKLFQESVAFSMNALVVNKLRTVLSLVGVTFGIFAIIGVFTFTGSLERNIKTSIASLGENVIFVARWPWTFGEDYPWWKYINRPTPSIGELKFIDEQCESAEASTFVLEVNHTVEHGNTNMQAIRIVSASHDYDQVRNFELTAGRYFTAGESKAGTSVSLIGADVALGLFGLTNPLGQDIKIAGRKLKVIGIFKREGESMVGNTTDDMVLLPVNFARSIVNVKSRNMETFIMVKAKEGVSNAQLKDELTGIMRSIRRQKPLEEQNFALNETSLLSDGLQGFFDAIAFAGSIIGLFSILVGGFGIANIMFVSVKERTGIIGIQKALGAKNLFILLQFLWEAITLCFLGGLAGLLLVYLLSLVVQGATDFNMHMSMGNIIFGVSLSIGIGLVSGIVPAWQASRLDPVEAIRA